MGRRSVAMPHEEPKHFAKKHGPDASPDDTIAQALRQRAVKGTIACAVAFDVAKDLGEPPAVVGRTADLLELRFVKCQLGLFGYGPKKNHEKSLSSVPPEIKKPILESLEGNRLPCETAWKVAKTLQIHKLKMGMACDALEVKIGPCQLGAF
jgi:hypothetical protein